MTDELRAYRNIRKRFAGHNAVKHSEEEYARKLEDGTKAHTNTVEGYYSIFKSSMIGVYQHCNERHCPATPQSLISATPIAPSALMMFNVPSWQSGTSSASG